MTNFGDYLRNLRGENSLREMERITGLSHTYLSSLEKGYDPRSKKERKPTPETLKKIAVALNVDYFELLYKAGYQDIAKSQEADFLLSLVPEEILQKATDLKVLLELNDVDLIHQDVQPTYNGHLLTSQDCERVLEMLRILFPHFQEPSNKLKK